MKVDVETLEPTRKRIRVEIPSDVVNEELQTIYREFRRHARVPGFRPGRAPIRLIKARFREDIRREAFSALLARAYQEALQDGTLEPLGQPEVETEIDDIVVEEDQPVHLTFTIEVKPEIELPPYSEIEIDKQAVNVPREAVDEVAKRLQEERAEYLPIEEDRPSQPGDFLTVDWQISEDGQVLESQTDVRIKLDKETLLPELFEALTEVNVGSELDIPVTYPENYGDPNVAGRTVVFHVHVKQIAKQVLPELNDEFAASLGYESYEQFVGATWNELVETEKRNQREQQIQEILKQLREKVDVPIPESFLQEYMKHLRGDYHRLFEMQGQEHLVDTPEFEERLRRDATERILNKWIIDEIAEQEDIEVADWELEREIRMLAETSGRDPSVYRQMLESSGRLDALRDSILEQKVYDFLIENASEKQSLIVTG